MNLNQISLNSEYVFTAIQLTNPLLLLTSKGPWLEFGECLIYGHNEDKCYIGSRMANGVLDFEHNIPYVVHIGLLGLKYLLTEGHCSYFEAVITTDPNKILIYPQSFDPMMVEDAHNCSLCVDAHWTLPDGYFTPPIYDLANVVAGKKVSITFGPRWSNLAHDNPSCTG